MRYSIVYLVLALTFASSRFDDAAAQSVAAQGSVGRLETNQVSTKLSDIESGIRSARADLSKLVRVLGGGCPNINSFIKAISADGSIVCGNVEFPPPPAVAAAAAVGGAGASVADANNAWAGDNSGGSGASASGTGGGGFTTYILSGGYRDDLGRWVDTYTPLVYGADPITNNNGYVARDQVSSGHQETIDRIGSAGFNRNNGWTTPGGSYDHPWAAFERWAAEQWAAVGACGVYGLPC